ncbi:MAG: molybdopterin-guanine dinucleotide biosynthesis protein B [Peptococcaceae bacterium]|nr:molybdopterin-guanine dinucleotide biosynthesis protein B [Peptococcaceae bacterium]
MQTKPTVIAVSGVKNSGKTTLIEKLIPQFEKQGLAAAVIKHDGHSFLADPENTDTGRYMKAGAWGTAVFDGEKFKVIKRNQTAEELLLEQFADADIVLLEGFKNSSWPKVEIVRKGNSEQPVCRVDTLLALVTDLPLTLPGVSAIELNNVEQVATVMLQYHRQCRGEKG